MRLPAWCKRRPIRSGIAAPQKPQDNPNQTSSSNKLGWGSNIQNARLARAAEEALKNGNYAAAVGYAQRAAEAAPNDPQLWFLLGYAARSGQKVSARYRFLRLVVFASIHLLSMGFQGLAQTYSNMGRTDEAERLLKQVLASDPKRVNDSLLLGELLMRSGDYAGAIDCAGAGGTDVNPARGQSYCWHCHISI